MYQRKVVVSELDGNAIQKAIDSLNKGGLIILNEGEYKIDKTLLLNDNITIIGKGNSTKLILKNNVNSNMITNSDHEKGNINISIKNLLLNGNGENQKRPPEQKRLSFCNGVYFSKVKNCSFIDIEAHDLHQTALHFNNCNGVNIKNFYAEKLGWSGFSTSGTDDLVATDTLIVDSGRDKMHSGIHLDGGVGAYLDVKVHNCTGNAIMIDSNFSPMSNVIVKGECSNSKRGISLSGSHNNLLNNVLITDSAVYENETGIMVSNASNVFIYKCSIKKSISEGILLQGKLGAKQTVISQTNFLKNNNNISEIHSSNNNYFTNNNVSQLAVKKREASISPVAKGGTPKVLQKPATENIEVKDAYTDICSVCGENGEFTLIGNSVREEYRCTSCKASLRHREQASTIIKLFTKQNAKTFKELVEEDHFKKLKIFEPGIIGPLRKFFKGFPNYTQSYYWDDIPFGESKNGIVNQDLMGLTYKNNTFDLIITADIFEHVRKPFIGFEEIHRVLKKGGIHVFTVPSQYPLRKKTHFRVDTSGPEDIHIDPPHYHIAGDGGKSLVYTEFGEDMFGKLDEIGLTTKIMHPDIPNPLVQKNITFYSIKK